MFFSSYYAGISGFIITKQSYINFINWLLKYINFKMKG